MMDASFLTNRIGGFPMWGWIAASVGVLLIWTAYQGGGGSKGKPDAPPDRDRGSDPYVFLLPQNAAAAPENGDSVGRYPRPGRRPGRGPNGSLPTAWGFEWKPYTVLGMKKSRHTIADTTPAGIAKVAYGLKRDDDVNASYFATLITENNPALDWSKPLPVGTAVMVPKMNVPAPGASPTQYN